MSDFFWRLGDMVEMSILLPAILIVDALYKIHILKDPFSE